MDNVTSKHTHLSIPVDLQFLAIPTRWTVREDKARGEQIFVPAVNQHTERRFPRIAEPEDIRKKFFKMEINGKSAFKFLNEEVGVWSMTEHPPIIGAADSAATLNGMRLLGGFGHRYLNHWASIEGVDELRQEQKHWRELCRNRRKLREIFGPGPSGDDVPGHKEFFAVESQFGNTLPVHLEWHGKHARAIIQPLTGREILIALAWVDLVSGAECKVCQNRNCGIEYTYGGRKFCSPQCEHANTVRTWRINKKLREQEEAAKRATKKRRGKSLH